MNNRESRIMRGTIKRSLIFGLLGAVALSMTACGDKPKKDVSKKPAQVESSQSSNKTKDVRKPDKQEKKEMDAILNEKPKKDAAVDVNKLPKDPAVSEEPVKAESQEGKTDTVKDQLEEEGQDKKQDDKEDIAKGKSQEDKKDDKQDNKKKSGKEQKSAGKK